MKGSNQFKQGGPDDLPASLPVRVGDYRLVFRPETPPPSSRYLGSAWRGALGHALRRSACVTGQRECDGCLLYSQCVYTKIFASAPPGDARKMRKYNAVPHPFVLLPGKTGEDEYCLQLRLFGNANSDLAHLIHALHKAGEKGVSHTRFRLLRVEQAPDSLSAATRCIYRPGGRLTALKPFRIETPPLPQSITVHFHTPYRQNLAGRLVTPERFTFSSLFSALLRRQSMLCSFYEQHALDVPFRELTDGSREVRILDQSLQWTDWTRKSARQGTTMQMGGITGHFTPDTRRLAAYWPWLWTGQWTHAGKATVMGLGYYRITCSGSG